MWYPQFRLGPLGGELDFVCQVSDLQVQEGNVEVEQRNLAGANLKSYLRHNVPTISLTLMRIPDSLSHILRGFQAALTPLNFIYNSSFAVKYLMETSATALSVIIPPTSVSGITITGVFLRSDYTQSGTNYYTSGSFDAATGIITLGTALPGANTDVWVNYTFSGMKCWIKVNIRPHQGQYKDYWQGTITLTGA